MNDRDPYDLACDDEPLYGHDEDDENEPVGGLGDDERGEDREMYEWNTADFFHRRNAARWGVW